MSLHYLQVYVYVMYTSMLPEDVYERLLIAIDVLDHLDDLTSKCLLFLPQVKAVERGKL